MKKIKNIIGAIAFLALLLAQTSQAHNKVVVIPLGGDGQKPLKNVITVAKGNGDFTDPIRALSSIDDASADNPYLVVIAPGVYNLRQNLQLRVKSYVDVIGSGQNSTILRGNIGSDSSNAPINGSGSLVTIKDNSSISNLTIENFGTTLNNGHGVHYNSGISTDESASLSNVTINVSSTSNSQLVGLEAVQGTLSVLNTKIYVSAGSGGSAVGMRTNTVFSETFRSFINMLNGEIEVVGGASNKTGFAFFRTNFPSTIKIQNSTINVPFGNVESFAGAGSTEAYISNSFLSGNASGANCSFVFTLAGSALNGSCN